jgi:hypothetical protein
MEGSVDPSLGYSFFQNYDAKTNFEKLVFQTFLGNMIGFFLIYVCAKLSPPSILTQLGTNNMPIDKSRAT